MNGIKEKIAFKVFASFAVMGFAVKFNDAVNVCFYVANDKVHAFVSDFSQERPADGIRKSKKGNLRKNIKFRNGG